MPHGGPRVGAGRPKIAVKRTALIQAQAKKIGLTPLEYMLRVMNDGRVDEARRDRMAVAAAPYVHAKAVEAEPEGKKAARQAAAEESASSGIFSVPDVPKLVVSNK